MSSNGQTNECCRGFVMQPMASLKADGDLFELIKLEVQRDASVRKRKMAGACCLF